jgi:cyclic pyranopterin phosphate synthase
MLSDRFMRKITDLRISITDRCNFSCIYCDPAPEHCGAAKPDLLTFEEIERIAAIFVSLGIEKIRLTGGEPLVRKGVEDLVARLAKLKNREPGARLYELALITNGSGFAAKAAAFKSAGLDRVTFSLDSLDRENFRAITGVDRLEDVVAAIHSAKDAGFANTKVNAVIIRGRNDHEIVGLARFARREGLSMRFIEFMPLDSGRMWDRRHVVSGAEIRDRIDDVFPLVLEQPSRGKETAWLYRFADGANGEIGIIAPVTDAFCGACSRVRLTADGQLRTCLFSDREYDLRSLLRNGGTDADLVDLIQLAVRNKEPGHSINSGGFAYAASRSMSAIGG